jgi:outer membrane protein TolC
MFRVAHCRAIVGMWFLGALLLSSSSARAGVPPEEGETAPPPRRLKEEDRPPSAIVVPPAPPAPPGCPAPGRLLQGPILSEGQAPPQLQPSQAQPGDAVMPINLPTALQLADARPIIIAAAQASLQIAVAQLRRAQVLWLPNITAGGAWYRHDGGGTGNQGIEYIVGRDQYMIGAGPLLAWDFVDLIFLPREARDRVAAQRFDVQTARNDALRAVAQAYFNVQQARGRMAGAQDATEKARDLARKIRALARDLTSPFEVDRALTTLADIEREMLLRYQEWRVASADLTRELRLNPVAIVAPLEPPHLQVTLISPKESLDELVPIGLLSRPELASQQALVRWALDRIRQERLRPWTPNLLVAPNAVPASPFGTLMGGVFASDLNDRPEPWVGRFDSLTMGTWEFLNLGLGNRALVQERQAERQRELVELFRIQDHVAAEIVQAFARVQSAALRISTTETEVKEARINYEGNLKAISETERFGDRLILITRPLEVVVALQQLIRAYNNYYVSVADYNKAQFQLFWALGYPAKALACERNNGDIRPVDMSRPPQMAPVNAPPPCQSCGP